jgi:diacylglycerol kinase
MFNRRLKSFSYAFKGLRDLFRTQVNARLHLLAAALVTAAAAVLRCNAAEWALLALTMAVVIAAEAFNTAIEYLTNLVSPDFHPLAGKVKDAAAAGVLLVAGGAAIVGLLLFLPKIFALLH